MGTLMGRRGADQLGRLRSVKQYVHVHTDTAVTNVTGRSSTLPSPRSLASCAHGPLLLREAASSRPPACRGH
eukprot:scaffold823_cov397-Prasinococcus_capsulatus_cf.AAC.8